MNRFSVVADGKQLDTYDNIAVSFNYQIEDILDITKRTTSYSKTITLPGTPFNNKFFKQIFDVNIDNISFNVKKSIPANINIGEQTVMVGVLQLLNIVVNQDAVDYEVVIMGQLKNVLNEFGELTLRNIDMSEYNHTRSKQTIQSSWTYDIYKNGSLINNSSGGEGYVYPYIIYGNNQNISNGLYVSDLYPSVYLKTAVDKMFDLVGYTYTSRFFNSEYFKKLILPFVDDKLQMTEEEINTRTFAVGIDGTQPETTDPLIYEPGIEDTSVTGYRAISVVLTPDVAPAWYENKFWASNKGFWFPFEKETGTIIDVTLQDLNNEWSFSSQTTPYTTTDAVYPYTYSRFECQNEGYYDIDLKGYMIMKYWNIATSNITLNSGDLKYYVKILRKRGNSEIELASTGTLSFTPSTSFAFTPAYDSNNPLTLDVSASNVYLEAGDLIYINFGFTMYSSNWAGVDTDIRGQALVLPSKDGVPTVLKITPSNNNLVGGDSQINMNQIMPDIKLKDLFLSVIKMFNLVVFDDPATPNNLIIEPRDEFYASRQRVVDWTYKLDYNQDVKITPMSELDVKTFLYTYREDGDYYNEQYTNEVKRIYGDYEIDIENDFSDTQNKLEVIFSPTPNGQYGIGDRVAPLFCTIEDNILKPKKLKPRILFYGGLKPTTYPMLFKDTYDAATGVTVNQYAYCGMWDDPIQPIHDLGFGTTNKVYWNGITYYPTNTLVEEFHKNTLFDIIDINSKLLEADFYLTPNDVADLDFRDIILIDNAYWRINKVKDYNPIGTDKTTSVVLYKINNLNIFAPDRVEISLSNKSCPTDVVKKFGIQGAYYVSASGQILDANCCSSLNGDFINGKCWVRTRLEGQKGEKSGYLKTSNTVIQGGTNITPNPQDRPEALMAGNNTVNSPGAIVRGQSNYVDYNVKSVEILGDGNSIIDGTTSTQIMGNGNTITNDTTNTFIFGDNNSIQPDLSNTGSTATTLSNIFLLGSNIIASSGNTLYTDNIFMSSASTFNGVVVSGVTNPTLSDVLTNGDTMLTTQKIASYAGLATIELDKVGSEGVYALSLDGLGGYSKLNLNKSTDATLEITDNGINVNTIFLTPTSYDLTTTDGTYNSQYNQTSNAFDFYTTDGTNSTNYTQTEVDIILTATDATYNSSYGFESDSFQFSNTDGTFNTNINTSVIGSATIDMLSTDGTNNGAISVYNSSVQLSMNDSSTYNNNISINSSISLPFGIQMSSSNPSSSEVGEIDIDAIAINLKVDDGTDNTLTQQTKDYYIFSSNNASSGSYTNFSIDPAFIAGGSGTSIETNDGVSTSSQVWNGSQLNLDVTDGVNYQGTITNLYSSGGGFIRILMETKNLAGIASGTVILNTDLINDKSEFQVDTDKIKFNNTPAFADDADAGTNGLLAGDLYQTDGTGAAPLNVAGIMMIKQ
jgi:hypothetical protein